MLSALFNRVRKGEIVSVVQRSIIVRMINSPDEILELNLSLERRSNADRANGDSNNSMPIIILSYSYLRVNK